MPNSWKGSRVGAAGIIALLVILVLIAISKDQNRRPPEPWQTYIGCGCLGVAILFWIILILTIATSG
jgi:RsiW-degrading membrane proteinase PrsW (M82 family)